MAMAHTENVALPETGISVRLPAEFQQTIEDAAAALGQSVDDFALAAVIREARSVLQESQTTRLSHEDGQRFLEAIDAIDLEPNVALTAAAVRYGQSRD